MNRGASVVLRYQAVGEAAARAKLAAFLDGPVGRYSEMRDVPGVQGTSRLSENLTYGEIGIREVWHAGLRARDEGRAGAESFLRELAWREFSYHLVHHTPQITAGNWRCWDRATRVWNTPSAWRANGTPMSRSASAMTKPCRIG